MTENQETKPSYIENAGKISFSYKDEGLYGEMLNECHKNAWVYAINKHGLKLDETLIDYGCSVGSWAENWKHLGFQKMIGVDVNPEVIEQAHEALGDALIIKDKSLVETVRYAPTVAANGVFCHLLSEKENIETLRDMSEACTDKLIFTAYECRYFMDSGKNERIGSNSCERKIETYRSFIKKADLEIVDKIGACVIPWGISELEYTAYNEELRASWSFNSNFVDLSNHLRGKSIVPFSEVMFIARRK